MTYKKNRGFTLVEMLIVIVIIGILAALALPQFTKNKEHAIGKEAVTSLKLIAAAEKIYRMEIGAYYPVPAAIEGEIADINNFLRLSIPSGSTRNWDYSVDSASGGANTFSATADRTTGSYSSCQYSINQTQDDPVVASGADTCP